MHPREFGKYRILELLPVGGMGRVYLALDPSANRQVALKLIEHGPNPEQRDIIEAERRGAILQTRLCGIDRRITAINGYGDLDGFFYIEMEYVEGQDLAELLAKGPLGVPFAARIGCDICEVLHHAHSFTADIEGHQYRGIVHGDIKPRNIRITPDGQVKVLDFGIAKALSLTRSVTQNPFASSQYSSPERLGTGEVDIASDLWSVAVVLYEMVTARPYFEAESGPRLEYLIRNYSARHPLPESLPARFRAILGKALAPDEDRRYAAARDFAADLKAFLANKPTVAEREPSIEDEATRRLSASVSEEDEARTRRTPALQPQPVAPVAAKPRPKRPMSRRERQVRTIAGLALGLLVFGLLFNEYLVWRQASRLEHEVEAERLTDVQVAWERYQGLARRSVVPVLLSGSRSAIKGRLIGQADRVIRDYRNSDSPSVTERDWITASQALSRALELDPDDREIRGKRALADGHILRIRGNYRKQPKLYHEARAKFEEARDLIPKSPDPYLGLARLYVYAFGDVERADQALRQADDKGHDLGRREKAQLADAHRSRGDKLMREAERAAGLSEEDDYLKRADEEYREAEDLYREIVPWGNAAASLRRVLDSRDLIAVRRDKIREGT
jgi:serine/threonine protein kinase